jgi:hypothetical protein
MWIKAGEDFWNKEKCVKNGKMQKAENITGW